jgi:hypothetical protein
MGSAPQLSSLGQPLDLGKRVSPISLPRDSIPGPGPERRVAAGRLDGSRPGRGSLTARWWPSTLTQLEGTWPRSENEIDGPIGSLCWQAHTNEQAVPPSALWAYDGPG